MKKILLSVALLATSFGFAQTLQSDNFNSLTIGNLTTDITAATAGQGGWFTESVNGTAPTTSTNANVTNYQVIASGNNSSSGLSIVGPNGDKGSRFMFKEGLPAAWTGRTSGNNIIEIEVDVNPGTRGVSKNSFGVRIYNADFTRTLAGFQVNAATGALQLVAYSTPGTNPVGNYSYNLADAPGVLIPENTWTRIGVSYNYTTGQVLINSSVLSGGSLALPGSSPTTNPAEIDFIVTSGTTTAGGNNTAAATMLFDNFVARASSTDTLLNNEAFVPVNEVISVYPNPAKDVLNIKSGSADINTVQVVDLNGRQVISKSFNNVIDAQINVSDLSAGMYLINITSGETTVTKKFLKQ